MNVGKHLEANELFKELTLFEKFITEKKSYFPSNLPNTGGQKLQINGNIY